MGRLIARPSSWTVLPRRDWKHRWLPADWQPLADGIRTDAGRVPYRRSWHGRAVPEWCADRHRLPACESRSCGKQIRRNASTDAGALASLVHSRPHNLRGNGLICTPVVHSAWEQVGSGLHPALILMGSVRRRSTAGSRSTVRWKSARHSG